MSLANGAPRDRELGRVKRSVAVLNRSPLLTAVAALVVGGVVVVGGGGGCYSGKLEPIPPAPVERADNKLSVNGTFCTTDPDELDFPVKVFFIIDTSQSMGVTDPDLTRLDAILDVVDAVQDQPGVEIGIETFGATSGIVTSKCDDYGDPNGCVEV